MNDKRDKGRRRASFQLDESAMTAYGPWAVVWSPFSFEVNMEVKRQLIMAFRNRNSNEQIMICDDSAEFLYTCEVIIAVICFYLSPGSQM